MLFRSLSGRNIRDICEYTERRWARKLLVKKLEASVPDFDFYRHALRGWKEENQMTDSMALEANRG